MTAQDARLRFNAQPIPWRPSPVPRRPRPVRHRKPETLPKSAQHMTLIAGFRCADGFVIAADTEVTYGDVRIQGHKLAPSWLESPHTFCIAVAGAMNWGMAAAQNVREAFVQLVNPTVQTFKQAVQDVLVKMYDDHFPKDWRTLTAEPSPFQLIIGVEDGNNQFAVFQTEHTAVYETGYATFGGSGGTTASYFYERLSNGTPMTTAVTIHFAQQLFREIKSKGVYVGGNTEIYGRRSRPQAQPFFTLPSLEKHERAVWGLDDILLSAVRDAVLFKAQPNKKASGQLEQRLSMLRKVLLQLQNDSHNEKNVSDDQQREFHLTEYASGIGNMFVDY